MENDNDINDINDDVGDKHNDINDGDDDVRNKEDDVRGSDDDHERKEVSFNEDTMATDRIDGEEIGFYDNSSAEDDDVKLLKTLHKVFRTRH